MRRFVWQTIFLLVAFMVGCNGAAGPEFLEQGVAALNNKQYDEAIKLLTKATERRSKSAEAYNYLGAAYQAKGEQTLAVRAFEKSISLSAHFPPPRFNLGVVCFERQQYPKAIEHLTRFVALQPKNIEGYFYLASAQFQTDDLRNAYPNYLKVVEGDQSRSEVFNNLGVISAKLGQSREAETWFNSCIKTDPKYSPAYLNIAILYHRTMRKPAAALDYYQRFLELEPAGPSSEIAKQSLAQLKKSGLTPAKTQEVATAKPAVAGTMSADDEGAKINAAAEATATSRPAAVEVAKTATSSTAPATVAKETVSTPPPTLGGPRWTTPAFPKVTPGKRDDALKQFNRGAQYQKDKIFDAAIFCYRDAIKIDPSFFSAYYNLGTALHTQDMANQAIDAYQRALTLQPNFTNARLNLAILFESQGYVADAADQYEAILKESPNDATAHLALGRLYSSQTVTGPLARQHYQRYLALAPNGADARSVQQLLQQMK